MNDVAAQAERLSCGAVVVRKTEAGWRALMLRAYRNWDFPKGIREAGENSLEAAIREIGEETGIADLEFRWGEGHLDTGPYSRGKVARYYLAATAQAEIVMGLSPETGQPEHHEARWMSFNEAYDLSSPRVRDVVQWARNVLGA
ncbi:MAG: NUDIX domain-containing protein [Pseudomonadota bacterium]